MTCQEKKVVRRRKKEKNEVTFTVLSKINMTNVINMYINSTLNALQLLLIPFIMVNIFKNSNYILVFMGRITIYVL